MKKILSITLVGGAAALIMSSCGSKMKELPADYFSTTPNPLEVVAYRVPAVVTGNIPAKFFVKDAVLTVTPVLAFAGTELPYSSISFQGEKVRGNNTVVSYANGGRLTIPVNYSYQPEMQNSELYLTFAVEQGGKKYVLPRVKVADGCLATSTLADAATVDPALTPDKFQRIINEKYSADIRFLINQANLRQSELDSKEVRDLNKTIADAANDTFREIKELNIQSYASPEGTLEFNTRLAENRERNTQDYLQRQLKKDKVTEFGELTSQFTPEDWEGFQRLVAASNIQDKDLILSVLSMYNDPETREQEIRNLSSVFDELADQILPQLRYSRITASIDVIGKSDNEINRAVDTDPSTLTADELLYAATLTDDPNRQLKIYEQATRIYPNHYRGFNNLGLVKYRLKDYNSAAANFDKAAQLNPSAPEVQMNQGLIALLDNDAAAANTAFGKAAGYEGLGDALGVYYIQQGDANAAVRAFGNSKTNNAAVAQILAKDYSKAMSTLNAVNTPDATTYYLKAIVAARTNNATDVMKNLAQVKKLDPAMASAAINDLEFANYKRYF